MRYDLAHALREYLSKNQQARLYAVKRLLAESGEKGDADSVIAHHPELGYRPGVLAALSVPPEYASDAARYLGAWHGTLTQDPDAVGFTVGDGPDKLHILTLPQKPSVVAQRLRDAGVPRFSLRPTDTHTHAFVYDAGSVLNLAPLAESLNGRHQSVTGSGVRLGQGAGAPADAAPDATAARASYRNHIRAAEGATADRIRLARMKKCKKCGKKHRGKHTCVALPGTYFEGGGLPVQLARRVSVTKKELKPWRDALRDRPENGPVFADWLEEKGAHHDDATLQALRGGEGHLHVDRHPRSGKVVAWRDAIRAEEASREGLMHGVFTPDFPATHRNLQLSSGVYHGPGGLYAVYPDEEGGRHSVVRLDPRNFAAHYDAWGPQPPQFRGEGEFEVAPGVGARPWHPRVRLSPDTAHRLAQHLAFPT